MVKVSRSTKGFKPYKTKMEFITLKRMIKNPFTYHVTNIYNKLNCIILICDRAEGEVRLIAKRKDLKL